MTDTIPVVWNGLTLTGEVECSTDPHGFIVSLSVLGTYVHVARVPEDGPVKAWVEDTDEWTDRVHQRATPAERLLYAIFGAVEPDEFPLVDAEVLMLDGMNALAFNVASPNVSGRLIVPAWPFTEESK